MSEASHPVIVVKKNTKRPQSGTYPAVDNHQHWIDELHQLWRIPVEDRCPSTRRMSA